MATCKRGDTTYDNFLDEVMGGLFLLEKVPKSHLERDLKDFEDKIESKYGLDITPDHVGAGCGLSIKNNRVQRGGKCGNSYFDRAKARAGALLWVGAVIMSMIFVYKQFNTPEPGKDYSMYMPTNPGANAAYGSLPVETLEKIWTHAAISGDKAAIDAALNQRTVLTPVQDQLVQTFYAVKNQYGQEFKGAVGKAADNVLESLANRSSGLIAAGGNILSAKIQTITFDDITNTCKNFYESYKDITVSAAFTAVTGFFADFYLKVQKPELREAIWGTVCIPIKIVKSVYSFVSSLSSNILYIFGYDWMYSIICKKLGGELTSAEMIELNREAAKDLTRAELEFYGKQAELELQTATKLAKAGKIQESKEHQAKANEFIENQRKIRRESGNSKKAKEEVASKRAASLAVASNSLPMNDFYSIDDDYPSPSSSASSSSAAPSSKNIRSYFPKRQ